MKISFRLPFFLFLFLIFFTVSASAKNTGLSLPNEVPATAKKILKARKVKTLTSNTVIVTDTKFLTAASAQTYTRDWEYASAFPEGPPTTS